MPNPKKLSNKKKKKKGTSANNRKVTTQGGGSTNAFAGSTTNLKDVISQADLALETSNIESAMQLYNYAAGVLRNQLQSFQQQQQQQNAEHQQKREECVLQLSRVIGKMAEMKVSMGDQGGGQETFLEATTLLSDETNGPFTQHAQWREARAALYLYLGQLSSANDALEAFTRAITDLRECVRLLGKDGKNDDQATMNIDDIAAASTTPLIETRRQLCGAYCSLAELYLTDLCFEANAEKECESALQAALELDDPGSSPDVVQAMANLRISQNRGLEAVSHILDAYSRVKVGCEALADLVGLETTTAATTANPSTGANNANTPMAKELNGKALEAANSLPGFESRCQMAKLLMECASTLEDTSADAEKRSEQRKFCVEAAIQVLGSLLAENDEVIEIWFLLGCAFSVSKPANVDASKHYFENAVEMLSKVKMGMEQELSMNQIDEEVKASIADIDDKIKEVQNRLNELVGDDDDTNMNDSAMDED